MKSFLLIRQSNMAGRGDSIHFNSASYRIFGQRYDVDIIFLNLICNSK